MTLIKEAQEKAIGLIMLERGQTFFDGLSKVKMNEQGYISKTALKEYFALNDLIHKKGTNP